MDDSLPSRSNSVGKKRRKSVESEGSKAISAHKSSDAVTKAHSLTTSPNRNDLRVHPKLRDTDPIDRHTRPKSRSTNEPTSNKGTVGSAPASHGLFLDPSRGRPGPGVGARTNYKCLSRSPSPSRLVGLDPDMTWKSLFQRQYSPELKIFADYVGSKDPEGLFCTPFWDKMLFGRYN